MAAFILSSQLATADSKLLFAHSPAAATTVSGRRKAVTCGRDESKWSLVTSTSVCPLRVSTPGSRSSFGLNHGPRTAANPLGGVRRPAVHAPTRSLLGRIRCSSARGATRSRRILAGMQRASVSGVIHGLVRPSLRLRRATRGLARACPSTPRRGRYARVAICLTGPGWTRRSVARACCCTRSAADGGWPGDGAWRRVRGG